MIHMIKKLVKNTFISTLSSQPVDHLATRIFGMGIPIFMLHRTYPENTANKKQTPAYLRQCLDYLKKKGFHFVSVEDILLSFRNNTILPEKSIAFTIDDGFMDQAALAVPVFIEYKCPVTIFLITGFIDGELWPWFSKVEYLIKRTTVKRLHIEHNSTDRIYSLTTDCEKKRATRELMELIKQQPWEQLDALLSGISDAAKLSLPAQPPEEYRPMSWDTARELEAKGISFGPHTRAHPILSRVSDELSQVEIIHSWQRLKAELKNPSPVFCYPNGCQDDFGKREIEFIKATDMLGAISTIPMQFNSKSGEVDLIYKMPRYSLPDTFDDFRMYSSWIEFMKEKVRNR